MLSLEETVLLMAVLLIVLLVTLTLAAIFRPRVDNRHVLRGWVAAFAASRRKKKPFVKEKKSKSVLNFVPQNREEGKSPYIVCNQYNVKCVDDFVYLYIRNLLHLFLMSPHIGIQSSQQQPVISKMKPTHQQRFDFPAEGKQRRDAPEDVCVIWLC